MKLPLTLALFFIGAYWLNAQTVMTGIEIETSQFINKIDARIFGQNFVGDKHDYNQEYKDALDEFKTPILRYPAGRVRFHDYRMPHQYFTENHRLEYYAHGGIPFCNGSTDFNSLTNFINDPNDLSCSATAGGMIPRNSNAFPFATPIDFVTKAKDKGIEPVIILPADGRFVDRDFANLNYDPVTSEYSSPTTEQILVDSAYQYAYGYVNLLNSNPATRVQTWQLGNEWYIASIPYFVTFSQYKAISASLMQGALAADPNIDFVIQYRRQIPTRETINSQLKNSLNYMVGQPIDPNDLSKGVLLDKIKAATAHYLTNGASLLADYHTYLEEANNLNKMKNYNIEHWVTAYNPGDIHSNVVSSPMELANRLNVLFDEFVRGGVTCAMEFPTFWQIGTYPMAFKKLKGNNVVLPIGSFLKEYTQVADKWLVDNNSVDYNYRISSYRDNDHLYLFVSNGNNPAQKVRLRLNGFLADLSPVGYDVYYTDFTGSTLPAADQLFAKKSIRIATPWHDGNGQDSYFTFKSNLEVGTNKYEFAVIKIAGTFSIGDCISSLTLTGNESNHTIYGAQNTINSTQSLLSSSSVEYKAEGEITMNPGFNTVDGATFEAYIGDCVNGQFNSTPTNKVLNQQISENHLVLKHSALSFLPETTTEVAAIELSLGTTSEVALSILGLDGKKIKTVAKGNFDSGTYQFPIDGITGGMYLIRLVVDEEIRTLRLGF